MTPEELTPLLKQGGTFRVPLTYPIFQAIRSMTAEQAQEVVNYHQANKEAALLAEKESLTIKLAEVQAKIDTDKLVVDGGVI